MSFFRAWQTGNVLCRDFDHLVPLVHLEDSREDYLVEVGWGSSNVNSFFKKFLRECLFIS